MNNMISRFKVKRGGMLATLVTALAGCGGGDAVAPVQAPVVIAPVAQVSSGTWTVMGSSTATGAGAPMGKGWVELLQTATAPYGAQFANIAVGGSVTYHGLSATTTVVPGRPAPNPAANIEQALSRKPVVLIVSYPSNDTALGYSVDETVNNLLAIRAQALVAGVPVMVTSGQPRNLSAKQLAQMRLIDERIANTVGACFVDVREKLASTDGHLASQFDSGDGVHPNGAGHRVIAEQFETVVNSQKCIRLLKH